MKLVRNYNLAIRGRDGKGSIGDVFWGDPAVFDSTYLHETVVLPSGSWEIALSMPSIYESFSFFQIHISRIIGYPIFLLSFLVFVGVYYLYHKAYDHSMHDDLTLLPNRRYFIYALQQMIITCRKKIVALCF